MVEASVPGRRVGRRILQLASLGVSAALVGAGALVLYQRIDWNEIATILLKLDRVWLFGAFAIYWLLYPVNSVRFRYVLRWLHPPGSMVAIPFRLVFRLTTGAGFVATAAPIGLMADVAKIGMLRLVGNLSITDAARSAVFDRVIAAQWMALFGFAALLLQVSIGAPAAIVGIEALIFAGVIASIGILLVLPSVLRVIPVRGFARLARIFSNYQAMLTLRRTLVQGGLGAINLMLVWATLYCLLRAAGLSPNQWLVVSFVPFLQLINNVPFLYLGWGGRELAMAATLGTVGGLSLNEALAVSAAWGITSVMTGAVNGVFVIGDWRSSGGQPAPDAGAAQRPPSA